MINYPARYGCARAMVQILVIHLKSIVGSIGNPATQQAVRELIARMEEPERVISQNMVQWGLEDKTPPAEPNTNNKPV